jgi:hypothetical protein
MRTLVLLGLALIAGCQSSLAEGAHADPLLPLLMLLVTVLLAAKLGGEIAMRLGQPSVLGELLAGVVLAIAHHAGLPIPDLESSAVLDILARLGVVVLLFEVGLESTVPQLLSVGARATVVALWKPYGHVSQWGPKGDHPGVGALLEGVGPGIRCVGRLDLLELRPRLPRHRDGAEPVDGDRGDTRADPCRRSVSW